jgi:hypothetical protein
MSSDMMIDECSAGPVAVMARDLAHQSCPVAGPGPDGKIDAGPVTPQRYSPGAFAASHMVTVSRGVHAHVHPSIHLHPNEQWLWNSAMWTKAS